MEIKYIVLTPDITMDMLLERSADLPPERMEKVARLRFERDKLRSLAAGLLIHSVTGGAELSYGEHGKPYANGVCFSVSHSGDIVAVAVDSDEEVGLDVEALPDESRLTIADRYFHVNERKFVREHADQRQAFCSVWTRKEAYLKMTGEGIATDLTSFDTTSPPLADKLFTVDLDGYCMSVCSAIPIKQNDIYISQIEL